MSKMVSRRDFLKMAGTAAGAIVLSACAPVAAPTQAPATQATPAAPAVKKAVKLRFWTHNYDPLVAFVQKKVEEYKSVKPGIEIEYAYAKVHDHEERLFTTLAAGTGPDGWNMGDWNYPLLSTKGWLAPVSPAAFGKDTDQEVMDMFFDFSLTGLVKEGKLYAIPFEWNALDLYYHRGAFAEVGLDPDKPPQTWEEVTEYAIKLTKRDEAGNIIRPGFQQSYGPNPEWPFKRLHPMLVQAGFDFLDKTLTTCTLNTKEAIEIVEYYTDWTVKHKVAMQGFEVPGVKGNPFRAGYVAMDLSGPYNPAAIKRANPNFVYKADDGWDVATFPQWSPPRLKKKASALWRWGLFVNNDSAYAEEMWAFIHFMVSDWRAVRNEVGYVPSIKGWTDDPENIKDTPWLPVQMKDLEIGVPVPQTPKYQELARQVLEMLERIYDGSQTVSESVTEACQKIDTILQTA